MSLAISTKGLADVALANVTKIIPGQANAANAVIFIYFMRAPR